jgi:hypothetical protein
MEADLAYYQQRSAEEAQAAATSVDPKTRDVHLELARRYQERVSTLLAKQRRASIHLVSAA